MITALRAARVRDRIGWLIHALALLGSPALARAQDDKHKCIEEYEGGQRARKQSALLRAKEAFLFCSSELCPTAMHADCSGWLEEVDAEIPKIFIDVTGENRTALSGVTLSVDLGPPRGLDAQPLALDPGAHIIVLRAAGHLELRESMVLAKRDSIVRHAVLERLPAACVSTAPVLPSPAPKPEMNRVSQSSTNWPAWVGLGVGTVGLAGFAYFGLQGRSEDMGLDACSPACSVERADSVRRNYMFANVSLGVGAVGLLSAGAWLLFAPNDAGGEPKKAAFDVQLGPITWVRHRF